MRLPEHLRRLFWEVDLDEVDTVAHADSILARVLEFGGLEDVRWLISTYGLPRIHRFFREVGHPEISARTATFWRAVFQAEDEQWASPATFRKSSNAPWID